MKRYKEYLFGVVEDNNGKYIKYLDHIKELAKLKTENEDLQRVVEELEDSVRFVDSLNKNLNAENISLYKVYTVVAVLTCLVVFEAGVLYSTMVN